MIPGGFTSYSQQLLLTIFESPAPPLFIVPTSFCFSFSFIFLPFVSLSGAWGLRESDIISRVVSGVLCPTHALWLWAGSSWAWSAS